MQEADGLCIFGSQPTFHWRGPALGCRVLLMAYGLGSDLGLM